MLGAPARTAPSVHNFDTKDNLRFWTANQASYQGTRHAALLARLLRPFLGTRILDAGAGDGSLVRELALLIPAARVTGVDLAPKAPGIEAGDLCALRFADGEFDSIVCSEVIEHTDPGTTGGIVRELSRVLAPGGVLALTTPWAEALEESTVTCPRCDLAFHRWGHQQRFTPESARELAVRHGLEPLEVVPVRFNRVERIAWMGRAFLRTRLARRLCAGRGGKRSLVLVARKRAG